MAMPPSSPRLPSPPPTAEIQMGPASPSGGAAANRQGSQIEQTLLDANSKRRIHRGTKATNMAAGPPLMPLNELDSAFQLQEHLAALHYHYSKGRTQPITRTTAVQLATPPPNTDRTLWLYELCRFLISQCNGLIVGFLFDTPACSAATCPEMRASEWQFLCAVHEQPKSCCAIDYCCHTLDWAANVVTDSKLFPSRFVALSDTHNKNVATKNLVNVFRRLHRIFAHAWFQHRSVFWSVEGQTGLYVFFKRVCDMYDLIPGETYKLPPEAEGLEPEVISVPEPAPESTANVSGGLFPPFTRTQATDKLQEPTAAEEDQGVGRTNTRRHIRSSPSTGSAVTTVLEADEEEGAELAKKTRALRISSPPAPLEEEQEAEDIPVIVESSITRGPTVLGGSPTDDAETPVGPSTDVPVEVTGDDKPTDVPEVESASVGTSEAPAVETRAKSPPLLSEAAAATVEEAAPEPEKATEDESPSAEEKGNDETHTGEPVPLQAEESQPVGDAPAPELEAPGPSEEPEIPVVAKDAEAPSSAADATPETKSEEEPKTE
ncbi:related to cell cycle regulation Mob3 [Cephalotrichum gorgonifer]|uniref:Related to cell cycle regulation Mob3 n=1 Tax=Cephalotrichum gorgonifer TaxID=2041049 RepID=A0AAE8MT65_9PEZI|nr:related to cell cycle regulation Mob3 [Cephalotrichum gorgonifer]